MLEPRWRYRGDIREIASLVYFVLLAGEKETSETERGKLSLSLSPVEQIQFPRGALGASSGNGARLIDLVCLLWLVYFGKRGSLNIYCSLLRMLLRCGEQFLQCWVNDYDGSWSF